MTYGDLLERLQDMCDDELSCPVMASVDDEFFPINKVNVHETDDRLRDGHPYLEVE
jgi:hypothetical protein